MIAHVIAGCMPHCHAMSQWTMSNVFEEILVAPWILKEGDNGWGMMARRDIPKPQFNTYKLLNRLGHTRLAATGPAIATTDRARRGHPGLESGRSLRNPQGFPVPAMSEL